MRLAAIVTLLGGMNVFADDCGCAPPPTRTLCCQIPQIAAYNAPSFIDACMDLYCTVDFTYWSASQENLELGVVSNVASGLVAIDGTLVNQNSDYAPGFQLGFGADLGFDNWNFFTEYTWFRNTDTVTTSLDPAGTKVLYPVRGKPLGPFDRYFYGHERWNLGMDFIDAEIGRAYYVGSALTFHPTLGLRGAFIRQELNVNYLNEASGLPAHNTHISQSAHSWGIGPRVGFCSSWMLGKGFRLYGDGSGDLLFTRYTTLNFNQKISNEVNAIIDGGIIDIKERNIGYLRTHLDLELGFGWGAYFYANRYHFDIAAGYDFQVFFNQNVFRRFTDDSSYSSILPNGDLFIQGLTISAQFDF